MPTSAEDVNVLEDDTDCSNLIEEVSDLLSELATTLEEGEKDMDLTDDFSEIEDKLQTIRTYLVGKDYIND